jgi:hypothetical protein
VHQISMCIGYDPLIQLVNPCIFVSFLNLNPPSLRMVMTRTMNGEKSNSEIRVISMNLIANYFNLYGFAYMQHKGSLANWFQALLGESGLWRDGHAHQITLNMFP